MIKHVDDEVLGVLAREIVDELLDSLEYVDVVVTLEEFGVPDTDIDDYSIVLWDMAMARITALREVL